MCGLTFRVACWYPLFKPDGEFPFWFERAFERRQQDWRIKSHYRHIILAGHSLGANKVIYYLSRHPDSRVDHFFLLSPANLSYMMSGVTEREKAVIREMVDSGRENEMLPFPFVGWVDCIAGTAWNWVFSNLLMNVWTEPDGDFSQCGQITHNGALLIGT